MAQAQLGAVVRHLRKVVGGAEGEGLSDGQLLRVFSVEKDQAAFACLVRRHGPMVLRVCRHVLRHQQDAEDAFQAVFLALARGADAIRKADGLAGWLHGVAYRVAMKAKRDAGRRRRHERQARPAEATAPTPPSDWREVQVALDEEIQGLPLRYRAPFVLCFLEGKSRAEAARDLGLKEGTVWSRERQACRITPAAFVDQ